MALGKRKRDRQPTMCVTDDRFADGREPPEPTLDIHVVLDNLSAMRRFGARVQQVHGRRLDLS